MINKIEAFGKKRKEKKKKWAQPKPSYRAAALTSAVTSTVVNYNTLDLYIYDTT